MNSIWGGDVVLAPVPEGLASPVPVGEEHLADRVFGTAKLGYPRVWNGAVRLVPRGALTIGAKSAVSACIHVEICEGQSGNRRPYHDEPGNRIPYRNHQFIKRAHCRRECNYTLVSRSQ